MAIKQYLEPIADIFRNFGVLEESIVHWRHLQ